jgi:ribosomal protein L35
MGYKYKPNKGCVKRFKVTATGKIKRRGTFSSHLRSRRNAAMKRRFMGVVGKRPAKVVHDRALAAAATVAAE